MQVSIVGIIVFAALFAGCIGDNDVKTLTVAGSTTVLPVNQECARLMMDTNPGLKISVSGGGSGHGIKAVGSGEINIGAASRDIKSKEMETYPDLKAVGIGALLTAALIGIPAAVYLAEFSPRWVHNIVKPCVEMLVGIPSIVLGFFGLMVLIPFIRDSFGGWEECILAGWIILAIMTLPHVISISEDSIRAVPRACKEASVALGATELQTIWKVILPNARSGILASLILGMGNAIGETMAVLMVIGNPNIPWIPSSILEPVSVLTSIIVIGINYAVWGSMHQHALFALGVVLFAIVAILNAITTAVIRKGVKR